MIVNGNYALFIYVVWICSIFFNPVDGRCFDLYLECTPKRVGIKQLFPASDVV